MESSSKRQGHAGVSHYMRSGYEPEAVLNFIMLLGWTAPGGREVGVKRFTSTHAHVLLLIAC
jgi:glutamyl/glutaminyl-tRNA synthetase